MTTAESTTNPDPAHPPNPSPAHPPNPSPVHPPKLPPEFADLEQFSDWCLPTEAERYAKRLASTMGELQAFYDAVTARAEEAIAYCDKFSLDDMPDDVLNLMHLLYSMIQASFPVECWKQPKVPDSGATTLDCVSEPVP